MMRKSTIQTKYVGDFCVFGQLFLREAHAAGKKRVSPDKPVDKVLPIR